MQIRCPDCLQAIEVNDSVSLTTTLCSNCGVEFQLICETLRDNEIQSVGHFELLHEVGRGAGGSVWKARDTKLDRIVAVKLPRTGGLGSTYQNQLLREAQAVAQLNHPNIVRVHEVGRNAEGIYIVSDFVAGITLEAKSKAGRMASRKVAKLLVKVCDALLHAHQLGVVHRDMKPSNIMLDGEDQPQVIDFGLAKRDASDATMTIEGKLLGTPAYMPPEQARGEGFSVDCRADIYSLGVILYELLTGELPFRGTVRMLLQQVIHNAATDPRTLNSSIPKDLATICLKCLEKDPGKRYQSCEELGADLQAWLDHKAIQARPIGELGRLKRWCQRRPVVASLTSLVVFVVLCGVGVSSYFGFAAIKEAEHARVAEREAKAQSAQSLIATQLAVENLKAAEQSKLEATINAQVAEKQRTEAENNLLIAQQTVDEFLTQVSQSTLLNQPKLEPLRRQLLEKAMEFYTGFSQRSNVEPTVVVKAADAHQRLASILDMLGNFQESVDESMLGIALLEPLAEKYPDEIDYSIAIARNCVNVAVVLKELDRVDESISMYDRASSLLIPWVEKYPDNDTAGSLLAKIYNNTGIQYVTGAQFGDAVVKLRKAIAIHERLVLAHPQKLIFRNSLGLHYTSLGDALEKMGHFDEAIIEHRRAVRVFVLNLKLAPDHDKFAYSLASGYGNCGSCLKVMGNYNEAANFQKLAVDISSALVDDHPDVPKYKHQLAIGLGNLATAQTALGKHDLAIASIQRSIDVDSTLLDSAPGTTMYLMSISLQWQNFSNVQRKKGDLDAAILAAHKAIKIREELYQNLSKTAVYAGALGESYYRLSLLLRENKQLTEAATALKRCVVARSALWEQAHESPEYGTDLGKSYNQLGLVLRYLDDLDHAVDAYSKAIEVHREVYGLFPQWHDNTLSLGGAMINSANTQRAQGNYAIANDLYSNAIDLLQKLFDVADTRIESRSKLFARNGYMGRASTAELENQFAEAIVDWEVAYELDESKYRYSLMSRVINVKLKSGDYRAAAASCQGVLKDQDAPSYLLQSCIAYLDKVIVDVGDDVTIDNEERQRFKSSYSQLAVEILERLQLRQYYEELRNVTYLLTSPTLATLRTTKEFQMWVSTLKRG